MSVLDTLPAGTRVVISEKASDFAGLAADADILVVGAAPRSLLEEVWPMARNVKWVHSLAAGLDTVLFPELIASPVPLTNSRGVFAHSLAEFAISGMLWFAKELNRMRRQQSQRHWEKFNVTELRGAGFGVVGHGAIGRATAALAVAFGMEVCGLGRVHTREELVEVLTESDYLLIGAPLTPRTRGLIGAPELRLMKPTSVLINLGRGPVVVEDALIRALKEGWIRGAVLDVFDVEPLPAEHPFWGMDNVLLSPHCADNTATWLNEAMELFLDNFARYDDGRPLRNVTTKELGY
jgi:phosphoglycerate dehydrogenase-like enzyme